MDFICPPPSSFSRPGVSAGTREGLIAAGFVSGATVDCNCDAVRGQTGGGRGEEDRSALLGARHAIRRDFAAVYDTQSDTNAQLRLIANARARARCK